MIKNYSVAIITKLKVVEEANNKLRVKNEAKRKYLCGLVKEVMEYK